MTLQEPADLFEARGGSDAAPLLVVRVPLVAVGDSDRLRMFSKERPRFRVVKPKGKPSFVTTYTPAKTRQQEALIRAAAIDAMAGGRLLTGYFAVTIFAYFPVPVSWPQWKQRDAQRGDRRPASGVDADNVMKCALDALNPYRDPRTKIVVPVVWTDDSAVVDGRIIKLYAKRKPGLIIEIRRATAPPLPWSAATNGRE